MADEYIYTNLGKVSLTPKGEYDSSTQYEALDVIRYDGGGWIVLKDCTGQTPTEGEYYMKLVEKGDKGDTGGQGIQGIQGVKGDKGEKGDKGDKGEKGEQGIQGIQGDKGAGVPAGGLAGQILTKSGNADYAVEWADGGYALQSDVIAHESAVYAYTGKDLSEIFEDADAFSAALQAKDFSNIHIGDYWPITLNGTYIDYSSYTIPAGATYYTDETLTTVGGTVDTATQGIYKNDNAVGYPHGDSPTKFVAIEDCTVGYQFTLSNAIFKQEVAAINPYLRHGDTEITQQHICFISRDLFPRNLKMRQAATEWYRPDAGNPWLGSALYETLNNEDNGILRLLLQTELSEHVYAGPNGNGMRAYMETMAPGASSPSTWAWYGRGRLFLPTESEVYGRPVWQTSGMHAGTLYNQFPIFAGSSRHIIKGSGNGGGRYSWWLGSPASASAFAYVHYYGVARHTSASSVWISPPLCFLFT